jgi:hypothetical protein
MQADGEEQQDDADLGELVGQRLIGHVARREGTDQDACEQIADQRRDPQSVRRQPEAEREHEPRGDRRDEWRFVFRHLALHLVRGDGPGMPAPGSQMKQRLPAPQSPTARAVGCTAVPGTPDGSLIRASGMHDGPMKWRTAERIGIRCPIRVRPGRENPNFVGGEHADLAAWLIGMPVGDTHAGVPERDARGLVPACFDQGYLARDVASVDAHGFAKVEYDRPILRRPERERPGQLANLVAHEDAVLRRERRVARSRRDEALAEGRGRLPRCGDKGAAQCKGGDKGGAGQKAPRHDGILGVHPSRKRCSHSRP